MALTAKKVYAILKRQISNMEAKLNSPVRYRGTVATADLLPLNPDIGDMYNIESKSVYGEAGMNVAWNGVVWDTMGAPIDMSLYLTKEEAETVIQRLVTEYFEKNPVKPGATTEQAQQIEQNKTDIASLKTETGSLKEDISTKITKFYASSQGETHLADSDNGKIQDMMVYGKSEQKQYSGKNLLNATLQTTTQNGVTCTANGDGTYTINGTATSDTLFHIGYFIFEKDTKYKIVGCPQGGSLNTLYRLDGSLNANSDTGNGIVYSGDGNKRNARIVVFNGATVNNLLFKPMITTDLTATYDDFEPYTGGIPSPNPDYPQEIKSVVNPTVKVCGKNLFDSKKFPIILNRAIDTNTGVVYESSGGKYCATEKYIPFPYGGKIISFNASMSLCAYDKDYKFISAIRYHSQAPFGTTYVRFDIKIEDKDKAQIELSESTTTYEPYHEQTVTLPYTLNAIPVSSGGNVTIDGQQYIADYVDVERGKVVKRVKVLNISNLDKSKWGFRTDTSEAIGHSTRYYGTSSMLDFDTNINAMSNIAIYGGIGHDVQGTFRLVDAATYLYQFNLDKTKFDKVQDFTDYLASNNVYIQYALKVPQELDLKPEEIVLFKSLSANYPVTNIFINSEQLDGYTVFNYPISMQNGWNYVKQQIGDTRDYIYDMDLQSAEAYVNSEYAVALTELEV